MIANHDPQGVIFAPNLKPLMCGLRLRGPREEGFSMLPNLRVVVAGTLLGLVLIVTAFGLAATVRIAQHTITGPIDAPRALAYADPEDWEAIAIRGRAPQMGTTENRSFTTIAGKPPGRQETDVATVTPPMTPQTAPDSPAQNSPPQASPAQASLAQDSNAPEATNAPVPTEETPVVIAMATAMTDSGRAGDERVQPSNRAPALPPSSEKPAEVTTTVPVKKADKTKTNLKKRANAATRTPTATVASNNMPVTSEPVATPTERPAIPTTVDRDEIRDAIEATQTPVPVQETPVVIALAATQAELGRSGGEPVQSSNAATAVPPSSETPAEVTATAPVTKAASANANLKKRANIATHTPIATAVSNDTPVISETNSTPSEPPMIPAPLDRDQNRDDITADDTPVPAPEIPVIIAMATAIADLARTDSEAVQEPVVVARLRAESTPARAEGRQETAPEVVASLPPPDEMQNKTTATRPKPSPKATKPAAKAASAQPKRNPTPRQPADPFAWPSRPQTYWPVQNPKTPKSKDSWMFVTGN